MSMKHLGFVVALTSFALPRAVTAQAQCGIYDFDGDGYEDEFDTCPTVYNPDQYVDSDLGGRDDACDPVLDFDKDWIPNASGYADVGPDGEPGSDPNERDNCYWAYNPLQVDQDADGLGDACIGDRLGRNCA